MTDRTLIVYQCGPVVVIEDCDEAQRPFTRSMLTPESAVRIGEHMAALEADAGASEAGGG